MIVMERLKLLKGEISIESVTEKDYLKNPQQKPKTIICVYIPKSEKNDG